MTINILQISSRSDVGGGPKHMAILIEELAKDENFRIFTASPTTPPFYEAFKTHSQSHISIAHRSFSLFALIRLLTFCQENKISIIHSHGFGAGLYSRALGLFGFKVIHTFHGIHFKKSFSSKLKTLIEVILKNATTIGVCVGRNEYKKAKESLGYSSSQLMEIPNSINFESFKNKVKLKPTQEKNILGTLCRLEEHKNVSFLINQLQSLPEDYQLIIGGDGPQKSQLEEQTKKLNLENRVSFLGEISSPENFYSMIDIFVSASLGEGFPFTILEAVAAKKPIIVSNVYGHREILEEQQLFNLNTPEDFRKKLLNVDKLNTTKIYNNFIRLYDSKTVASKMNSLYQ